METKSPAFTTPIFNPSEITEIKEEKVVETKIEEPQHSKASAFANLLKGRKDFMADVEIPTDLDWDGLIDLVDAQAEKRILTKKEQEFLAKEQEYEKQLKQKFPEEIFEYAQHLAAGGSNEAVTRASALHYWEKLDAQSEEDKEDVVRVQYQIMEQSDEMIDAFIETKLNTPEALDEAYKKAKAFIAQTRLDELEADKRRGEELKRQNQERVDSENGQIKKAIRDGFHGLKLDEMQANALEEYMLSAKHFRDIDTPEGKKRISETTEAKTLREMTLEDRVLFGYLTQFGLKNLVAHLDKRGTDKFLQALESADDSPARSTEQKEKQKIKLPPNAITVPIRG